MSQWPRKEKVMRTIEKTLEFRSPKKIGSSRLALSRGLPPGTNNRLVVCFISPYSMLNRCVQPRANQATHYSRNHSSNSLLSSVDDDSLSESQSTCDDEGDPSKEDRMTIQMSDSVYHQALVVPLLVKQQQGRCGIHRMNSFVLLAVNLLIQVLILLKINELVSIQFRQDSGKLFSLCQKRQGSNFPFAHNLVSSPADDFYYDCLPIDLTTLTNVSQVDLNRDGRWTRSEAAELRDILQERYRKDSSLDDIFDNFIKHVQDGYMDYQTTTDYNQLSTLTKGFTEIPMDWMAGEQTNIIMCMATMDGLCPNLVIRGVLRANGFGLDASAWKRIAMCRSIISNKCPYLFGQTLELYQLWSQDVCGEQLTLWDNKVKAVVTMYEGPRDFLASSEAMLTHNYQGFLFIMLMIWLMTVLAELREIFKWWVVLLTIDSEPSKDEPAVKVSEEKAQINAIDKKDKAIAIIFNLAPRTAIALYVSVLGLAFLTSSKGYNDLLLNGVALGFLIEIDDMLYMATVGDVAKSLIAKCEPIGVKFKTGAWLRRNVPPGMIWTLALSAFACLVIAYDYQFSETSKIETGKRLECLCQAGGEWCVAAQIFGGNSSVGASMGDSESSSVKPTTWKYN